MSGCLTQAPSVSQGSEPTLAARHQGGLPEICPACAQFLQTCRDQRQAEAHRDSSAIRGGKPPKPLQRVQDLGEHGAARGEVRVAAEAGCPICKLVWGHIKTSLAAECTLQVQASEQEDEDLRIECRVRAGTRSIIRPFGLGTYDRIHVVDRISYTSASQQDTGSSACLELVKTWYEDCTRNHTSCPPLSEGWYPKRLLKLDGEIARLVITADEHPTGAYATLSHCWGGEPFEMLTTDTWEDFRDGIIITAFPPSFRDAMQVALFLGINYIWIDCFTIFQGDDEMGRRDFEEQSRVMHLVYTHGAINLGAASAANPFHGCFARREAPGSCWGTFPSGAPATHMVYAIENLNADFGEVLEDSPLFSRAWVLQERILAGRMVHFTDAQLFWTCGSYSRSETSATTSHQTAMGWNEDMKCSPGSVRPQPGLRDDRQRLRFLWHKIVMRYSASILTFPHLDKKFAIRGIATQMAMALGDTYLDGMLVDTLPDALLWSSMVYKSVRAQRSGRLVPSWSWMSMDGAVRYNNLRLHCVPGAAELNTDYNVCLTKILHGEVEAAKTLMIIIGRIIPVHGHLPDGTTPHSSVTMRDIDHRSHRGDPFKPDDGDEWDQAITEQADLYALLMSDDGEWDLCFIVLARDGNGLFRRLGCASVNKWRPDSSWKVWIEAYWLAKAAIIIIR